jgi:hypothetical protein
MVTEIISWIPVVGIILTASSILVNRDWRIRLGALAVQYVAAFWLISRHLPFVMGSAKLITGWMVVAALGMTCLGLPETQEEKGNSSLPRGNWFRITFIFIIALGTAGATPRIESAIPGLGFPLIAGSLFLIGVGAIHLGMTSDTLNAILGLLTLLTGFEILYSAIESSILVSGLLAATNLGLGITGSYLMTAGTIPAEMEDEP